MKFSDIRWGAGILLVALAGCADSSLTTRHSVAAYAPVDAQGNPNQSIVTRDSVKRRPFRMPENFTPTAWEQMVIGVNPRTNVYASSSSFFSNDDLRYMGSRLQSELAKLKRFSIQDIEDADHAVLEELSDVGEVRLAGRSKQPSITHVAQWNMKLSSSSERTGTYSKRIVFTCAITFKLTERATQNIVHDSTFDVDLVETQKLDSMGRVKSGFNWYSSADLKSVIQRLSTQAAIHIANILGNENPCGGKVVACLSERAMVMENGTSQGIANGMQMLVYATIEGVPVPLAYADAQPGPNRTKLDLWKFNDDDPFAKQVLDAIKADRASYKQYDLNAVALGEALPPIWRRNVLTIETDY